MTGYIDLSDRLNPEGEEKKALIGQLVSASEKSTESSLRHGALDLIITLHADEKLSILRAQARKWDPVGEVMYGMLNPPPQD